MKYIDKPDAMPTLELTRRNLEGLLEKLDDPNSKRTLIDPDHKIAVRAVENEEHYKCRAPGVMLTNGTISRRDMEREEIRVRGYNSTEEMFAEMAADEKAASEGIVDKQREIDWGSYAIKTFFAGNQLMFIFLKVDTLDELVEKEKSAGAELDELSYYRKHYQQMHDRNYRRGEHYSEVCPNGEFGDSHLVSLWPITQQEFDEAAEHGWTPSEVMWDRIRREMAKELSDD